MKLWMKRALVSLGLSGALCFPAAANDYEHEGEIANQVHVIMENRSLWDKTEMDMDTIGYLVTDLDHNGRLEILVSRFGGTGLFTYTDGYELNEAKDGLYPITKTWIEGQSEMDLMMKDTVSVYTKDGEASYWYVFEDVTRDQAWDFRSNEALSLQHGMWVVELISMEGVEHKEDGTTRAIYNDVNGKQVSKKAYDKQEEKVFKKCKKHEVRMPWLIYHRDNWQDGWVAKSDQDKEDMLMKAYFEFAGE